MSEWAAASVLSVLAALVVGWAVPAWSVSRLLPLLDRTPRKVTNYRGVPVPTGLGVTWAVWAVGVALVSGVISIVAWTTVRSSGATSAGVPPWLGALTSSPFDAALAMMPVLLVLGALVFGMFDDAYGYGASKGFRGHLRELVEGRLTTGSLKMLGIGALAVWAAGAASTRSAQLTVQAASGAGRVVFGLAAWACGALTIALAANLVNLSDLRPGRALKTYGLLATVGVGAAVWATWRVQQAQIASGVSAVTSSGSRTWLVAAALCLALLVFGPVVALWRADLGERAMLGDAGANAMGALAGYLLAANLPLVGVALAAAVLLALNLASEKVSFSGVIERSRALAWLDRLGRTADGLGGDRGDQGQDLGRGGQAPAVDETHEGEGRDGGN